MPAGPWRVYNSARHDLLSGDIQLDSDAFVMRLYQNNSNAADVTKTNLSQLTNEVAGGGGYTSGGQALSGVTWAVGTTPDEMRFSANPSLWTGSGAGISNARWAVIAKSSDGRLFCYCEIDTAPVNVGAGDPLLVEPGLQVGRRRRGQERRLRRE